MSKKIKQMAKLIKDKFDNNFEGKIISVVGEEWYGGNLSYHLESRPKWFHVAGSKKPDPMTNVNKPSGYVSTIGVVDEKISNKFSKICKETKGIFYIINNIGFCLNGSNKK